MRKVFIVVKRNNEYDQPFCTNEAVFGNIGDAEAAIEARKRLKDRDDHNCSFTIEPWHVS